MAGAKPLGALLLLAVVFAGCSGDGDGDGGASTSSSSSGSVSASVGVTATSTSGTSSSSSTSAGPAPLTGSVARDITDNDFPDGTFTVAKGTTVTWTHRGSNPHDVTEDNGAFDSSPNCPPACMTGLPGTNTFSHTFDAVGTFPYHCDVHPSMAGAITVV